MTTAGGVLQALQASQGLTERFEVTAIERGSIVPTCAEVCVEDSVNLLLNEIRVASLTMTPDELVPFAYGYLVCEGLVRSVAEVRDVAIEGTDVNVIVDSFKPDDVDLWMEIRSSGCVGVRSSWLDLEEPVRSQLKLDLQTIFSSVSTVNELAGLWRRTGGTHCSAIFDPLGGLVSYAEDIGRHNTIDKAVGKALLDGRDLSECFLVTTGRAPAGMVAKVYRAGMPAMISNTAPLSTGVELARRLNMTLAGFARPPRMYVYSGPERIKEASQ
ncbi:formate dehydrogenase accessory sulfurtransferase FdhD [Methanocella arvoryzae]|uniref:formate dehydrogenase accessory sulfurtransferase FdhD n=1 Tax=Methanocella arvoryzae TaxID=1175445 RepID=UPI0003217E11|nr:formate dehydrogenase accessory sulfurtransferase FdhD [Methanocella arvoryzae]